MKKLEHEADFKTAKGGELGVIQGVEGVTFEVGLAGGGSVEGSENMEKGAFPASAGSGDGHNLPRKNFQGDTPKGVNLGNARGVGFMEIASLEHRKEQIL